MNEEELLAEAKEIEERLKRKPEETLDRGPLIAIGAIAISLLFILMAIPYWSISLDPEPERLPTIAEVLPGWQMPQIEGKAEDYYDAVTPDDPVTKQVATRVATFGCGSSEICQAKSVYYFVRNNFAYVAEQDDYYQTPQEMLYTHGGDCDDHAILLASMLRSIGITTRFVIVPRHVYVEAYIPDAPKRYRNAMGWIALDATCKSCEFGQIPQEKENRRYY